MMMPEEVRISCPFSLMLLSTVLPFISGLPVPEPQNVLIRELLAYSEQFLPGSILY